MNTGYKHMERVVQLHVQLHRIFDFQNHCSHIIRTIYVKKAQGVSEDDGTSTR